ncbi:MAG: 6-phospho-3-hexuloisomerase [Acetobacteraceae bacterium]
MGEVRDLGRALLAELTASFSAVCEEEVAPLINRILEAPTIFIDGKGRSGLQARGFAMRLMHLGLRVHVVDEVTTPALTPGDLLIIASGSGRTPSLVQHASKARELGAVIALITATPGSLIAGVANHVVEVRAPTPKSGERALSITTQQPMASLFEMTLGLLFDAVVVLLMRRIGITSERMFKNHANLE